MIRLKFETFQEVHAVTLHANAFRLSGNFLRNLAEKEVLGEYRQHQWHVSGGHFSQYQCLDACWIYFTDIEGTASNVFGPFGTVRTSDGTMYADDVLFAKFIDETLLWHSFRLETYWPALIIADDPGVQGDASRDNLKGAGEKQ
jgi:hypothetical protein